MTDALEDAPPAGAGEPERSKGVRNAVEWVAIVIGALAVALLVKTFLIQAFYIPSGSMLPTLHQGDRVLVNKLDTGPSRGELVVFERPPGQPDDGIKDLIKRVVGLEGETIESRDGVVYVDGEPLDESYLPDGVTTTNHVIHCGKSDIPVFSNRCAQRKTKHDTKSSSQEAPHGI